MIKRIYLAAIIFYGHYFIEKPIKNEEPKTTSERNNDFFLDNEHLKLVLKAKADLIKKGCSPEWMQAQLAFFPKIHNRNQLKTIYPN